MRSALSNSTPPPSDLDEELVAVTLEAFHLDRPTILSIIDDLRSQRHHRRDHESSTQGGATTATFRHEFNMRSAGASSTSRDASSVELAHDNATDVSEQLGVHLAIRQQQRAAQHRSWSSSDISGAKAAHSNAHGDALFHEGVRSGGDPQQHLEDIEKESSSVDTICSRLAAIERLYDRRNFVVHPTAPDGCDSFADSAYRLRSCDEDSIVDRGEAARCCDVRSAHLPSEHPGVFPEDSHNKIASRVVTHKDWCPFVAPHGRQLPASFKSAPQSTRYFDPNHVKQWVQREFPPRHTLPYGCRQPMMGSRLHKTRCHHAATDVIFGDEVFRVNGDANPLDVRNRAPRSPSVAGVYKMLPAHRESRPRSSSLAGHRCPSTLPRWEQVDRVSRLNHYRQGWDRDRGLRGVLGKRDATSWEVRTRLDDYRRHNV